MREWKPEPDLSGEHEPRIVKLPPVRSFGRLKADKWLLLKTLEEAAELVEAGKRASNAPDIQVGLNELGDMLSEWADLLQTLVNTAVAFGFTDEEIEQAMADCLERNRLKGRL